MKKYFPTLLISILLFPSSFLLYSQDENYDAVYFQLKKEYTLNPDGSMDYRYMKKQKLQTYRAFFSLYGESFIVYHPDFQTLKVNEAYTVMADGKKNPSPANAFNEVLPGFAANAPAYNKLREMVITHSGTERNAILNLDYSLHTQKGFYPCLMGNELLCETEPVKELTFVIRIPSGATLNYSVLNSKETPFITREGDLQVYTWKIKDIPAISTEELQKGGNDLYPRVIFSSAADRNTLYRDFQKQEAFSYGLNTEMKQAVDALAAQYKDKADLVLKLQDKVVNELRLYPVPLKYTGFTSRTSQETWNSNGGTVLEKAVLLTSLLKEAGLSETCPVITVHNSLFDGKIGSLVDLEDVLVKVNIPETGTVYLSVNTINSTDLLYSSQDKVFVELKKPDAGIGKVSPCINTVKFEGSFAISDKKQLTGSITCSGSQGANPFLLLLKDKHKAKSLFGGGLSSSDLKEPVTVNAGKEGSSMSFSVMKEKPLRSDSDYYFLQLPVYNNGIESLGIHLLPKERSTPLEVSSRIEEEDEFMFVLPEKTKPFLTEEMKEIKNHAGIFIFEIKTKGEKTTVKKSLKLNKRIIEPSEYAEFKALMDHWNAERYREVVFKVTK
ncbi:MAG: DUF3857 domain-containing protein [Bacteroidetes bacterium]|nr:DUF3857 domain-containing protein [Bacteroidota bacterium]